MQDDDAEPDCPEELDLLELSHRTQNLVGKRQLAVSHGQLLGVLLCMIHPPFKGSAFDVRKRCQ